MSHKCHAFIHTKKKGGPSDLHAQWPMPKAFRISSQQIKSFCKGLLNTLLTKVTIWACWWSITSSKSSKRIMSCGHGQKECVLWRLSRLLLVNFEKYFHDYIAHYFRHRTQVKKFYFCTNIPFSSSCARHDMHSKCKESVAELWSNSTGTV